MNSKQGPIKFSFEAEDSNSISFFDPEITCKNKRFITSVIAIRNLVEYLLIMVLFLILICRFTSDTSVPVFLKFDPL